MSVSALIGLTAERHSVSLPLASWGAGTRRFAALAIAEQNQGEAPITLVDEVERGLEPYRQHVLMQTLQAGKSQAFVTTHSPSVISAASSANIWFVDHTGNIGLLDPKKTGRHLRNDPEAFLARLTIVAEGATECGFVTALLEKTLGAPLDQHGVHVIDAVGNDSALDLLDGLRHAGLAFGGFADDEGRAPGRWKSVSDHLGNLLFRWPTGCLDENIIGLVPDDKLESLIVDPEGKNTGMRLRTLADRLKLLDKDFATLSTAAGSGLSGLVTAAALGKNPPEEPGSKEYSSQSKTWFKSVGGGRELAEKVFSLGLWPTLRPKLLPFCNAVRQALGLQAVQDIPS